MNDNTNLIARLIQAALGAGGSDERLLVEAATALQPRQPDDPLPNWVRHILRNNDKDWAKRMNTQREQAENAVAELDMQAAEHCKTITAQIRQLALAKKKNQAQCTQISALRKRGPVMAEGTAIENTRLREKNENQCASIKTMRAQRNAMRAQLDAIRQQPHSTLYKANEQNVRLHDENADMRDEVDNLRKQIADQPMRDPEDSDADFRYVCSKHQTRIIERLQEQRRTDRDAVAALQQNNDALVAAGDRAQEKIRGLDTCYNILVERKRTDQTILVKLREQGRVDKRAIGILETDREALRSTIGQIGALVYLPKNASGCTVLSCVEALRDRSTRAVNVLQGGE